MASRVLILALLLVLSTVLPVGPAAAGPVSAAHWMGSVDSIADLPLTEIPIPGTHDSATSALTADSPWSRAGRLDFGDAALAVIPKQAAAAWSRAQPTSVGRQLEDGIRYLDLRLTEEPDGQVYLEHGLRGPLVHGVLGEIGAFARSHPREVVIVALNRFTAFSDTGYGIVRQAIEGAFGDRLVTTEVTTRVTPRQLWALDRNVILIDQSGQVGGFGADSQFAPWANTTSPAVVISAGRANMASHDHNRFFVLGTALTPDTNTIVGGAFRGLTSLAQLAVRESHPPVAHWLSGLQPSRNLNIVTTDWYTNPMCGTSFVQLVLSTLDGARRFPAACDLWQTGSGVRWDWGDLSAHTWVDLAWTPVAGAARYEVRVQAFVGGGCVVGTTQAASSAQVRIDRRNVAWAEYLCLGSEYDLSVRAEVDGRWSVWSVVRRTRL